jgi:hypothetical protein
VIGPPLITEREPGIKPRSLFSQNNIIVVSELLREKT